MALQDIASVAISLQTSGISRAGFGTPIFITAHNAFSDRVRSYTDPAQVGADFGLESNAYKAAVSCFSNEPSVASLKIGRLIAPTRITPQVTDESGTVIVGTQVSLTVEDQTGEVVTVSHTVTSGQTAADVVDALVEDLTDSDLDITATDGGTYFTIARGTSFASGGDFYVSAVVNATVTAETIGAETGVAALTAIRLVDDDFYVVAWENHTNREQILALASSIEAMDKLYFYGSSALSSITDNYVFGDVPTSLTDIIAYLTDAGYARTIAWWHQDADTDFNELAFAGYNLPFDGGSVTWANIQVPVSNAKNASGNRLTPTEEGRLSARNANWASVMGNIVYNREGKVVGGEWIDVIRGRDNLKADLIADIFDLLTNQQGGKIPYTNKGINLVSTVVGRRLNLYKVNRQFLTDPISIDVPKAEDIPREDKVSRVLRSMTFTATLAGAIHIVDLRGTLTL